jgi:aspartate racemase
MRSAFATSARCFNDKETIFKNNADEIEMKKVGIVGGMAWTSTVDYYAGICRRCERWQNARDPGALASMPEIAIESLDLKTAFSYLGNDASEQSWAQFDEYHRAALKRLEGNGAEFAVMAANSPHHRFHAITQGIRIPVINMLDIVAEASSQAGSQEVLILGTALAMRSPKFREPFSKYGIHPFGPGDEALRADTVALVTELQLGNLKDAAQRIGRIARASFVESKATGHAVYLACTELLLAFPDQKDSRTFTHDGIFYLNSTALHIDATFELAIRD